MDQIDISTLLSFHKQEASEELAYLTIFFAVTLGIISFLGSAPRISILARTVIAFIFSAFHYSIVMSLLGSLAMHSAIHEEISYRTSVNCNLVETEVLRDRFLNLSTFNADMWQAGFLIFGILIIIGIFMIGNGNLYEFYKERKKTKEK